MKKSFFLIFLLTFCAIISHAEGVNRIDLQCEQEEIFLGMDAKVSAVCYDKDNHVVDETVSLSVEGGGSLAGGTFIPDKEGAFTIRAACGDAVETVQITVLSHPVALRVFPRNVCLAVGETAELSFVGYTAEGKRVPIPPRFVHTYDEEVSFSDGKLSVLSGKGRTVDFFFRGTETVLGLDVKTAEREYLKLPSGSFYGFPEAVSGSVNKSIDAVTLSYAFSEQAHEEQTAYIVFSKHITVADNKKKVYVTVSSEEFSDVVVRAMLVDDEGKTFRPVLMESVPKGSKEVSFYIPDEAVRPVRFTRLSVETLMNKDITGCLHFSSFGIEPDGEISRTPKPALLFPDAWCNPKPSEQSYVFSIASDTLLGMQMERALPENAVMFGSGDKLAVREEEDILILIGAAEPMPQKDREKLLSKISSANKTIVLCVKDGTLSSAEEAIVFSALQTAAENHPVFYITDKEQSESLVQNGIRYITLAPLEYLAHNGGVSWVMEQMQYFKIACHPDGTATYTFQQIWE